MSPADTLRRRARLAVMLVPLLLAGLLAACGPSMQKLPFRLTDVGGHLPDLDFHLTDDRGKAVTGEDYRGKVVLLYFGYTHCPDVCPLTLARLHVVLQRLGPLADDARILFVSVDPARDTVQVMHQYVDAFDKRAVGLTGDDDQIAALAKRYRVAYGRGKDRGDGNYEVNHSSAIYIFDRQGRARVLATPATGNDGLVHDLHLLLAQGS